jgi:hypothetical protein
VEGERIEGKISECPFSGAAPGVCRQCAAFSESISSSIVPGSKFHLDASMATGDPECRWVVEIGDFEKPERFSSPTDAMDLLRKRLVMGEITPEQYRTLRDILLEK